VHATAGKGNSRNSAYCIVHRTPPQNRKARSLAHPNSITDPYMLWCWIDILDRECSTAAVDLDRTTHGSCVALHSPLSGVAIPGPRPCLRRRAFPCWVSSASSGQGSCLYWRTLEDAGPVSGGRRAPHNRHRCEDPRQAPRPHPLPDEDRLEGALGQRAAPDRVSKHSRPSSPHCLAHRR
jgi:hypothetical protein